MDVAFLQKGALNQRFPDCGGATGGGGGAVNTVFGRSGDIIAMVGDYNVSQITGAVPNTVQVIAGSGLSGGGALTSDVTLNANVVSVFGRIGPITAQAGDYSASMVTNAVDSSSYYSDPTWLGISWAKVSGKPSTFPPSAHTHPASDIVSGIMATARLGSGSANNTTFLRGDGLWAVPPTGTGGQNQTPWLSDIQGAGFSLFNVMEIDLTDSIWISDGNKPVPWVSIMNVDGRLDVNQGFRSASHCSIGTVDSTYSLNIYGDVNLTGGGQYLIDGVPFAGGVSTVFGRSGAVTAQSGDYTAAQVTNALSSIGSYSDPAWLVALDWSKLLNKPSTFTPTAHTHSASEITSGVLVPARLGTGTADNTTYLRGDGTWQTVSAGGSQTPWLQDVSADGYSLLNAGHIRFKIDATYDIGQSGALRPRYLYNAFDIYAGGNVTATSFVKTDVNGAAFYVNHSGGGNNGNYGLFWDKTNEALQFYAAGAPRWQIGYSGHFLATTDNSYDIGSSGAARPRTVYAGTSFISNLLTLNGTRPTVLFDQGATARGRILQSAANHQVSIGANAYHDGTAWQRDDTSNSSLLCALSASNAGVPNNFRLYYAPAGTGAIPFTAATFNFDLANNVETIAGTRPTILFDQGATARGRVFQPSAAHQVTMSANAYYDGVSWQRDDTASASTNLTLRSNLLQLYYSAAGTGPITFNSPFTFDLANGRIGVGTSGPSNAITLEGGQIMEFRTGSWAMFRPPDNAYDFRWRSAGTNAAGDPYRLDAYLGGDLTNPCLTVAINTYVGVGTKNPLARLDALSTIRAMDSTQYPSSGAGLEMAYSAGSAYIQSLDRGVSPPFKKLYLEGLNIHLGFNSRGSSNATATFIYLPAGTQETLCGNSGMHFYLNEAGNQLLVRVKYSTGTVKGATLSLV